MTYNSRSGFTLIELLVSLAIFVGAIVVISKQLTQLKRAMASARLSGEISHLRESLRGLVHCGRTLNQYTKEDGSIDCNGAIALRDFKGSQVSQMLGPWEIENSCSATGIVIKAKHIKMAKDPLTGRPLDFSSTRLNPLMGRGTPYGLCENSFKKMRRVKIFKASNSELEFSSSDCSIALSEVPFLAPASPLPDPIDPANLIINVTNFKSAQATFNAPFLLAYQLHDKCSKYCKVGPRFFTGGYLVDCNSSEVTCVCFR